MITKLVNRIFANNSKQSNKEIPSPQRTPYQIIGGEEATRAISNRFYDIMSEDEYAKELLAIHPQPLDRIRQVFFEFLSGWLGGPTLFENNYGHPRLRQRHMPFSVTPQLKDQWMYCMTKTLDYEVDNPLLRAQLKQSFDQLATHMINREA